jgi:2-haloacid dehalogenase
VTLPAATTRPRLITFDVYTALLDYESGLLPEVKKVRGHDALALTRTWRAKQLEYAQISNSLGLERIPFRVITRRALDYVFARAGEPLDEAQAQTLCAAWDRLPAWPEAAETLAQLRSRGYQLGLLSNGDEEMLRAAAAFTGIHFDHVLASDHAGHYKPHPAMYALPSKRLGLRDEEVLHVAGSPTDVLGAKVAGLPCAWSNRNADRVLDPRGWPDYEMADLSGLLALL